MKSSPRRLPVADARAILRLVSGVSMMPGSHAKKQQELMKGLAILVGADSWIWCYCPPLVPGEPPRHVVRSYDGMSDAEFSVWLKLPENPEVGLLSEPFFREMNERRTHLTRTQPQLDPDGRFYELDVRFAFAGAGVGAVMLSHRPMPDGAQSVLSIYRRPGRPHFDEREARIAHIVLSEVDWLHREGWTESKPGQSKRLSPRERIVFNAALEGRSRPWIAVALGISEHTVGDHLKAVYRKLGVASRAQLIARFRSGDGGDIR